MNIASVDLNLLKAFEALHDESSASRAALRLGVTQSAMSAALRRLRELYGDPLFVRTGRGLAPTLRANQLKPVISEALNKCRQSLAMVDPNANDYQGRSVTLGLSDDFEIAYGRGLIEAVAQRAPKLRLIFRQSHSQIVGEALLQRSIDLAISAGGFAERLLSRQVLGEVTGVYRDYRRGAGRPGPEPPCVRLHQSFCGLALSAQGQPGGGDHPGSRRPGHCCLERAGAAALPAGSAALPDRVGLAHQRPGRPGVAQGA